ncbi:hypothetical protein JCM8547_000333 [Rhodosporidiobolus lusitaniae]
MSPYAYPEGNAVLHKQLNLLPHPEGGYYAETVRTKETIPSVFADGAQRSLATEIYYLLDPASPKGKMHMNKSIVRPPSPSLPIPSSRTHPSSMPLEQTFHTLHQGRARYTLVKPLPTDAPEGARPEIKEVVMGADTARGEVRQLLVEGGWWKASEIPSEDLASNDKDSIGCLISEVVVPGFDFEDHKFLSSKDLLELFRGDVKAEGVEKLKPYVRDE